MSDTLNELQQLISERFALPIGQLDPDKPMESFGVDSLSLIELLFILEDRFHLTIPSGNPEISTLRELARWVDELRNASQPLP